MATYEKRITNENTGETVLIKSNDYLTFQSKIEKKLEIWKKQEIMLKNRENKEQAIQSAKTQTVDALKEMDNYSNILNTTLGVDDKIDWENLKNKKEFKEYSELPKPEKDNFFNDVPKKSWMEIIPLFKKRRKEKEEKAEQEYQVALKQWEKEDKKNREKHEKEKGQYLKEQKEFNENLESLRSSYEKGEKEGVVKYINLVLEKSKYPDSLNLFPDVNYNPESHLLLIDMEMPNTEAVPSIVEYKYIASSNTIAEKAMAGKAFDKFYEDIIYQITLRTIHEIFESDYQKLIDLVVFNGWVNGVDPKTGKDFRNCIVSLQATRDEFLEIKLDKIIPQDCFRHLKGVSAGPLVNLAPVKPIMIIDKNDKRIIKANEVIDGIDRNDNLAIMDWQNFEILVRDLIQKEFSHEGCTVEVTRASRDAGVDAIAFDNDPIRGGKYVIQAKRYNNLVPLSAVRDLYGTVHNEGAVKGILVTTSYYGKDSLEFVKDKPLKLINGEELLYMFNKHGYDFKIELTKKQKAASTVSY